MKSTAFIFGLFCLGLPSLLRAQQVDTAAFYARDRRDTLQAAVYTARQNGNFLSKGKEIRTEVISAAGLCKMACCNLAESFENSASVTVGYSDATTGARQIRLLGLSGIYTQMLDENRPVMRGLSAPFGLSYVPGQWLESIQIAKGMPSVINGSEPMTGQINMEHRKPTDEIPLFVQASFMDDTKGDLNLASAFQLSPELYVINLGHVSGNLRTFDHNGDGFVDDPAQLQFNLSSRWLLYRPDLQLRWGVRAISDHRHGGSEGVWESDIRNRSLGAYFKMGIPLREDQSANIALVSDWTLEDMQAGFGPASFDGRQQSGFLNLLYSNTLSEVHSFTTGASLTVDALEQRLDRMGSSDASFTTLFGGLFGEYTLHLGERFSAITGLRADAYKDAGLRFVPRLTLKYQPAEALVLRANGGRGLRYALPLIDNIGVFSTGRAFAGDVFARTLEDAWTFGGNATLYLPLGADPSSAYLSLDWFRSQFRRAVVADYETAAGVIDFYTLGPGDARTDSWQLDFNLEPVERLTCTVTARYTDARARLKGQGMVERPLTSRFKGVLNLQYRTPLSRWIFDATASLNGSCRVLDSMTALTDDDGSLLYPDGRTPVYPLLYAQVTRRFKGFDIYAGGENLSGFRQRKVVIADPSVAAFDASSIWGPIMGARFHLGFRLTFWR
ncbi:MAG: TonB-dependent receptor [Bacteroidales bacterium]|nr:TonB-dependent receptor [Bacteroidales bacterium]